MKTKTKILIGIFITLFFIILIANKIYVENDYTLLNLTCEYQSDYVEYEETLKFVYVGEIMYDYTRNEVFTNSKDHPIEETYEAFNKVYESVKDENSDEFSYIVKLDGEKLKIDTHIKVLTESDKFDTYMKEKDITSTMTLDEVESKLEKSYNCTLTKE